ncbi:hypothetical protein GGF31_002542 [Allomyces arbusculus]|nr:hypothetical protein GGF31_002542 [Allomyces arbusculus]
MDRGTKRKHSARSTSADGDSDGASLPASPSKRPRVQDYSSALGPVDDGSDEDEDWDDAAWETVAVPVVPPQAAAVAGPAGSVTTGGSNGHDEDNDDEDMVWEDVPVAAPASDRQEEREGSNATAPAAAETESSQGFIIAIGSAVQSKTDDASSTADAKPARRNLTKADRIARRHAHHVHLLCLLAAAHRLHVLASSPLIRAIALSCVPPRFLPTGEEGEPHKIQIRKFLAWFRSAFTADLFAPFPSSEDLVATVINAGAGHPITLTLVVAAMLWAMGVPCRLVAAMDPIKLSFQGELRARTPSAVDDPPSDPGTSSRPGSSQLGFSQPGTSSQPNSQTSTTTRPREVVVDAIPTPTSYPLMLILEVPNAKAAGEWTPLALGFANVLGSTVSTVPSPKTPYEIASAAGLPTLTYAVALHHPPTVRAGLPDIKDVSVRYLVDSGRPVEDRARRLPLDDVWWRQLCPTTDGEVVLVGKAEAQRASAVEDQRLLESLLQAPFPTRLGDYKAHRLYVLERHLKANEVVFPKEPVLGKIKGEAIYPRGNVRMVLSKDAWLRQEGRQVKDGVEPIKVTKTRGKDVELFGDWQTEPYAPPAISADGKIPRNKFDKVEVFHPAMVPTGTRHLLLSGLKQVAKQLGIDCADALTGFEFRSGKTIPVTTGVIVPESAVEVLLAAYEEVQGMNAEREAEERTIRIARRWAMLARKLVIHAQVAGLFQASRGPTSSSTAATPAVERAASGPEVEPSDDDEEDKMPVPRTRRRRHATSVPSVDEDEDEMPVPRTHRRRRAVSPPTSDNESDNDGPSADDFDNAGHDLAAGGGGGGLPSADQGADAQPRSLASHFGAMDDDSESDSDVEMADAREGGEGVEGSDDEDDVIPGPRDRRRRHGRAPPFGGGGFMY